MKMQSLKHSKGFGEDAYVAHMLIFFGKLRLSDFKHLSG